MAGYGQMTNPHDEHYGINWTAVAGYTAGGSVALGMMRSGYRAADKKWRSHNGTSRARGLSGIYGKEKGIPGGRSYQQLGASAIAGFNRPAGERVSIMKQARSQILASPQGASASKARKRAALSVKARNIVDKAGLPTDTWDRVVKGDRQRVRGEMKKLKDPIAARARGITALAQAKRAQSITGGEGMWADTKRAGASAVGWLGAFDRAGEGWGRAAAMGTRAGMVGLGLGAANAGLGWVFD